ncbi:MAG: secondary thiamine-phosphate synthase enzyme YjbQ [Elusimicrobiota bacterium]
MLTEFTVKSRSRTEFINITGQVSDIVSKSKTNNGICHIFVPHTTAGLLINENADPDVPSDIISQMGKMVPQSAGYSHSEGNSAAHIKSCLVGISKEVIIENGRLLLGTWQGIFFAEFDGPRIRKVFVKILKEV